MISGLVVGCVFNFHSSEGSNLIAIILIMKKKIAGAKLEIESMTEPQKWLEPVLALYIV